MSHRIASYVVAWALVAGTACGGDHAAGPSATYSRSEGKSVLPSTFTHERLLTCSVPLPLSVNRSPVVTSLALFANDTPGPAVTCNVPPAAVPRLPLPRSSTVLVPLRSSSFAAVS